jgi:GT2 family glycosyltransferase
MGSESIGRKVEIIENSKNLGFGTACEYFFILSANSETAN